MRLDPDCGSTLTASNREPMLFQVGCDAVAASFQPRRVPVLRSRQPECWPAQHAGIILDARRCWHWRCDGPGRHGADSSAGCAAAEDVAREPPQPQQFLRRHLLAVVGSVSDAVRSCTRTPRAARAGGWASRLATATRRRFAAAAAVPQFVSCLPLWG